MMSLAFAMIAAAVSTVPSAGQLTFDCDMRGPAGTHFATQFDLHGTFDGAELRTNMADWLLLSTPIKLQGGLQLSAENLVHHFEWNGASDRKKLNVRMVEYSNQHAAVLTVVQRYSDGRHSVDTLIGTGMCEVRRGSPTPGNGQ